MDDWNLDGMEDEDDLMSESLLHQIERDLKDGLYQELIVDPSHLEDSRRARSAQRDFTHLRAWQLGMDFVKAIYDATTAFPRNEEPGITLEIRRAAVLVPSRIAEGSAYPEAVDYVHFLSLAGSSLAEVKTLLLLSEQLGYLAGSQVSDLLLQADEVVRQLTVLQAAIEGFKSNKS